MHVAWNWDHPANPHDFVHDNSMGCAEDRPWRENCWAGAYGPCQIAPFARGRKSALDSNLFHDVYLESLPSDAHDYKARTWWPGVASASITALDLAKRQGLESLNTGCHLD